ncbi:MAG: hypothetical protein K2N31_06640 [Treponemataceae bacterium]|nr:hypothetical protein [Treponemataceae bacterium]
MLALLAFLYASLPKTVKTRRFYSVGSCFCASKILSLLAQRVFGLQKHFRRFPGAFSRFKSIFAASPNAFSGFKSAFATRPACSWASKALSRLSRRIFALQKYFAAVLRTAYRVFACSHGLHFCRFAAKNTKTRGLYSG